MKTVKTIFAVLAAMFMASCADDSMLTFVDATDPNGAYEVKDLPYGELHVDGRYLKGESGQTVRLHGFAQTFQPYYNENAWDNYDVNGCLAYNKKKLTQVLDAGWQMTFVRQHMDPYWCAGTDESLCHVNLDFDAFKEYLEKVYIPMAEYAIGHGLYVVMRPPGVCPEEMTTGDAYNQYLIKIWDYVSSHEKIKNNPGIMFEIANEPVKIEGTDGSMGSGTDAQFAALSEMLQSVVDVIRGNGANNVIWLPGLGYQSQYSGFINHPVKGDNIGFSIHCYPGWYGSDAISDSGEGLYSGTNGGYASFQAGWDNQLGGVPDNYPILVTEMDWSNSNIYPGYTWGQGVTGTAGGAGFGENFKYITDNCGNVSFLVFTGQEHLAQFVDEVPEDGNYTFYNDPENSCLWPVYHWFEEYAGLTSETRGDITGLQLYIDSKMCASGDTVSIKTSNTSYMAVYAVYADGTTEVVNTTESYTVTSSDESVAKVEGVNEVTGLRDGRAQLTVAYAGQTATVNVEVTSFPLDGITANIYGNGNTYNTTTHTLITDAYGFGGWQYSNGLDISGYNYLVVEMCKGTNITGGADLRIFDENNYWADPASYTVDDYRMIIDLRNMKSSSAGNTIDPSHIYIVGFWTYGGETNRVVLNNVYVTDTYPTDTYVAPDEPVEEQEEEEDNSNLSDYTFYLEDLNYNIWNPNGTASFDTSTGTLILDSYGFGGWEFPAGLNLSGYKYLVVDTEDGTNYDEGIFFRMFDENSYWSTPANFAIKSNRVVINLKNQAIDDDYNEGYREVDTSHIYIMGFWSFGGEDYKIVIKDVYATNTYPED